MQIGSLKSLRIFSVFCLDFRRDPKTVYLTIKVLEGQARMCTAQTELLVFKHRSMELLKNFQYAILGLQANSLAIIMHGVSQVC